MLYPNSLAELDQIRDECRTLVARRAGLSAVATVVPIPLADIGADATLLMEMIPAINRRFGLSAEQIDAMDPQIKQLLLVGLSSVGSELIGRYITRPSVIGLLKRVGVRIGSKTTIRFVPIAGHLLAAGISYQAMRALGNAHIDDCYRVLEGTLIANLPVKQGVVRLDANGQPAPSTSPG